MSDNAIDTRGLTRRYGSLMALDAVDYVVPKGTISGLIGPNGAGKTTLLSLLCGYLRPNAGGGDVLGAPLGDLAQLKGRLGVYPQDAQLDPRRTVWAELTFWGELSGLGRDEARSAARSALERVGLADRLSTRCKGLSHGMARRAGIAGALLGKPELVLLDEPTSGLDPRAAHEVRSLVGALEGATVVISSHNLAELQDLCGHAVILNHGKIVASGPLESLTNQGAEVRIECVGRPANLAPIEKIPRVLSVEATNGMLTIRFDTSGDTPMEEPLAEVLRRLLDEGARIREVRQGRTLEERFLELTG
jgi:ABC-type multidrug transport system ATPase subunit